MGTGALAGSGPRWFPVLRVRPARSTGSGPPSTARQGRRSVGHGESSYRTSVYGPSGTTTRFLPAAGVVHLRYLVDARRPWCGVAPLTAATIAGRLSAETAAALADAEGGPRGNLLPLPVDGEDETSATRLANVHAHQRGQPCSTCSFTASMTVANSSASNGCSSRSSVTHSPMTHSALVGSSTVTSCAVRLGPLPRANARPAQRGPPPDQSPLEDDERAENRNDSFSVDLLWAGGYASRSQAQDHGKRGRGWRQSGPPLG